MEITFLGTGAGVPSKERNVTAIALSLLQEQNSVWLFDCGEATQHQILNTTIKPRKINKIFITHLHGDHIFGLPGFLSSRSFQGGSDPLYLYGPEGIRAYVETSLRISQSHLTYPLIGVTVQDLIEKSEAGEQLDLFTYEHVERKVKLNTAIHTLTEKFGKNPFVEVKKKKSEDLHPTTSFQKDFLDDYTK
ncbi:MBL fold metallo-hydrolase [Candidatus Pseudothioglobus singularis]|nr:MBL fold metallo-hydrolase [Candidatus Pseudothioglobus singularis]